MRHLSAVNSYAALCTLSVQVLIGSLTRAQVLHLQRWLLNYWRDPYNVILTILRAALFGLICGTSFYNRPFDPLGASERFAILFFSSLYADLTAFAYLPMVFFQRPIFYRERAERMYRTATYALGYVLADVPMIFAGVLAFTLAFYFFTGLERDAGHFFFYLFMSQLNTMVSIMFVQAICCIFSRPDTGGIIYASLSIILTTASGFLIPPKDMPAVIRWVNWVSFPRYFIESVSVSEFDGATFSCHGNSAMEIPINASVSLLYCDVATRYAPFIFVASTSD